MDTNKNAIVGGGYRTTVSKPYYCLVSVSMLDLCIFVFFSFRNLDVILCHTITVVKFVELLRFGWILSFP